MSCYHPINGSNNFDKVWYSYERKPLYTSHVLSLSIRPPVSLVSGTTIENGGDGTIDNPYVIIKTRYKEVTMPSWSIHLAVAKKVNEKLNIDKDIFYIGNLIADIDYDNKVSRRYTHYDEHNKCKSCPIENVPDINKFLKDYKDKLKDSLILGYYVHILTDYFYNNYIFSNCWILNKDKEFVGIKLKNNKVLNTLDKNKKIRKKIKHYDLDLYGKYLFNNSFVELPKYNEEIKKSLILLKDNFFSNENVLKRIDYLNDKFYDFNKYTLFNKIFGLKYKLFYKEELDRMFEECIEFILCNIKKIV